MASIAADVRPSGSVSLKLIQGAPMGEIDSWASAKLYGKPQRGLPAHVNAWRRRNWRRLRFQVLGVLWTQKLRKFLHAPVIAMTSSTFARVLTPDGSIDSYGLASMKVVTDAGVAYIVDAFQNITEVENFKYHGFGTGGTAEAVGNTALVTELTTEYAVNSTRPTGSQTEASAAVYRTVGTLTPDAAVAITEHGIFSADTAGTLLDRSLFSVLNIASGNSLEITYDLTFTSGG